MRCKLCSQLGRNDERWRLRPAVVAAVVLWVTITIGTSTAILVDRAGQECRPSPGDEGQNTSLVLLSICIRYAAMVISVVGILSYLFVSCRTPRPSMLHAHGILVMMTPMDLVGLIAADALHCEAMTSASYVVTGVAYAEMGIRRVLLYMLTMRKMKALGSPARRSADLSPWGRVLIGFTLVGHFGCLVPYWCWSALLHELGIPYEGGWKLQSSDSSAGDWHLANSILFPSFAFIGAVSGTGVFISGLGFVYAAVSQILAVLTKMADRQVMGELLVQLRSTLQQHLAGLLLAFLSNKGYLAVVTLDYFNMLGEDLEDSIGATAHLVDVAGDITGIILLSGIGALLFQENSDAGNITGHIQSLLHAAVLTSRADSVFEGRVAVTPSNRCIASFPGRYLPEWNALTWLCEQGECSSACVFLPTSDSKERFAKHADCPETPGICWCHSLYGAVKPWGCLWFDVWRNNIEEAMSLGLDLVVVFFPRQAGLGHVRWEDLGQSDLWNGIGLGGSQKAEVAYLRKKGYSFVEEGLETTRKSMNGFRATLMSKHDSLGTSVTTVSSAASESETV